MTDLKSHTFLDNSVHFASHSHSSHSHRRNSSIHIHRQSQSHKLSPALSSLLSSTTITCPRNKRRSFSQAAHIEVDVVADDDDDDDDDLRFYKFQQPTTKPKPHHSTSRSAAPETLITFAKKDVCHNNNQPQMSHIRSGLGQLRSMRSSSLDDQHDDRVDTFKVTTTATAAIDFATTRETPTTVAADILWRLHEEEDDQDDDAISASSSFSSIGSNSLSTLPSGYSPPRRRWSFGAGQRIVSPSFSSVDDQSHPLAKKKQEDGEQAPDQEREQEQEEVHSSVKLDTGKKQSFMAQFAASIKSFTFAASSHQPFLSFSDILPFSPRSTDESIPTVSSSRRSMNLVQPTVVRRFERSGAHTKIRTQLHKKQQQEAQLSSTRSSTISPSSSSTSSCGTSTVDVDVDSKQTATTGITNTTAKKPKLIALITYSFQEFVLPPPPRAREFRENPDFLRIYALETMMRKTGKLNSDANRGKARVLLMPRSDEILGYQNKSGTSGSVGSGSRSGDGREHGRTSTTKERGGGGGKSGKRQRQKRVKFPKFKSPVGGSGFGFGCGSGDDSCCSGSDQDIGMSASTAAGEERFEERKGGRLSTRRVPVRWIGVSVNDF